MVTQLASGHCLCGAIRFKAHGEPLSTNFCHCESCRRHTGSVAASFVTFPKHAVEWTGGDKRARHRSSPPVSRSFCGSCGSPLAYEHDDFATQIDLYLGAFDDPASFPPQKHVYCRERIAWFDTVDNARRYETSSSSREAPVSIEPTPSTEPPTTR